MLDRTLDDAFARHVRLAGMATGNQVEAALRLAADSSLSLGEALVRQGVITPLQRETVEKKLEDKREHQNELGGLKILKKLGEGGMGAVYLAQEGPGGRRVAVKVLPKELALDPEFVMRFRREAEAATRLEHPNIVRAFKAGEDKGYHYIVLEYCEGRSLKKRIEEDGFLPHASATSVVLEIARGLAYAHAAGFIHRDIKPENVMITPTGAVKVLDLGLAKNLAETQDSLRTATGAALGTPHYISPEQARGEKGIDGRTDIYSLGATYYHALTGTTPFSGTSIFEVIQKHLLEQLPDPRDVRPEIPLGAVVVLRRMMAKSPSDRYGTVEPLIEDLKRLEGGHPPQTPAIDPALTSIAKPVLTRVLPGVPRRDRRLLFGGVAAGVVLAIVALAWPPSGTPSSTGGTAPPPTGKKSRLEEKTKEPPKPSTPSGRDPTDPSLQPRETAPQLRELPFDLAHAKNPDAPDARWRELLPLIDPKVSAMGTWTRTPDALLSPDTGINTNPTRIWIPYSPPDEYDAVIVLERVKGTEDLILGFPQKGRLLAVVLDGWWQEGACGAYYEGGWKQYPGGRRHVLPGGKPVRVGCSIRSGGATITVDGQVIMTFPDLTRLAMPDSVRVFRDQADGLVLGTVRSSIKFTSVGLLPCSGEGRPLR